MLTLRPRRGLGVRDLCLGGGLSSVVAQDVPLEESTAIIHACLRHGIRDYDTAPLYGQGQSEQKLGVALLSATEETVGLPVELKRGAGGLVMTVGGERVAIHTKTGRLVRHQQVPPTPAQADGELAWRPAELGGRQWPQRLGPTATDAVVTNDYTANGAFLSFSESRERLGADLEIHSLRIHDADSNGGPGVAQATGSLDLALSPEGMLAGLRALRRDGMITEVSLGMNAHLGLQNPTGGWTPSVIIDFIRAAPPGTFDTALLAYGWNLCSQDAFEVMAVCEEYGIAVHLGGIFGGTTISPIFDPLPEHVKTVAAWQDLADKHSVSLAAVAIAFAALPVCVEKLVVGMRSVADVERNVAQISEPVPALLWKEAQEQGLLRRELNLQLSPQHDELSQIKEFLAGLEREIVDNGGRGKSSILRVTFELADLRKKQLLNDAWAEWVRDEIMPARAVVGMSETTTELISANLEVAPVSLGQLARYTLEPGLYHLATVTPQIDGQRARVYLSGISAEMELGDDVMTTADLEVQTNAVLDTVEQLLQDIDAATSLADLTLATVYLVGNDWLVKEGVVKSVLTQRGVTPECHVSLVAAADLGPSTLVEIVATAELHQGLASRL
eukprot:COSAG02_NODE_1365_length_13037_cov_4.315659_1_plen_616_part_00